MNLRTFNINTWGASSEKKILEVHF